MVPEPLERARHVLVSPDGAWIALVGAEQIELVDAALLTGAGQIGIDAAAEGVDVALIGDPLRLVVVARYDGSARLHVIDPRGPTAIGELALRSSLRMIGASGDHVWLTGPSGSVVVDVVQKDLATWPLALRTPVSAAGAFSGGRFVVSTGGAIEEWDPETRAPVRRLRVAKPITASHIGGGARQVWLVQPSSPDSIELAPLINQGQPLRFKLPEPVGRIAADPSSENLIVIGADSRAAYAVDLSGRAPVTQIEGLTADDAAWIAGTGAIAVAVAGAGIEVIPVVGRVRPARALERSSTEPPPSPHELPIEAPLAEVVAEAPPDANVAERLSAWREKMRATAPREMSPSGWLAPVEPPATWRDHLASWTRSILSGTRADPPVLGDGLLADVAARAGLDGELAIALWLLYGAHLCGLDGVAPVELAGVLRRRWSEALGTGALASSGVARWRGSRAYLARPITDALDERPPRFGTAIGDGEPSAAALVAIVAPSGADLAAIARWAAPQIGPLFVATPRGATKLDAFLLEARVRGALPVMAWPRADVALPSAALLVVTDEAIARAALAPVLARWPLAEAIG